jgi:acyl carrier protein
MTDAPARAELLAEIRVYASRRRGISEDRVVESARLVDDLELDSLDLADMALEWEERHGFEVEDQQLFDVTTVGDVITLVLEVRRGAG